MCWALLTDISITFTAAAYKYKQETGLSKARKAKGEKKRNHFKRMIQPAVVGESSLWDNFIQVALAQKDMVDCWGRAQNSSKAAGVVVQRMMPSLWAAKAHERENQIRNILTLRIYIFL